MVLNSVHALLGGTRFGICHEESRTLGGLGEERSLESEVGVRSGIEEKQRTEEGVTKVRRRRRTILCAREADFGEEKEESRRGRSEGGWTSINFSLVCRSPR